MIHLRVLEREDLKQLRDWRNDPEIFSRVREYRYLNMENQEAWFNSLRDDRQTIMFGIETDSRIIGVCGLTNIDWIGRKAEVSIYVGNKEFRGKGLGKEILDLLAQYAFEECNLNRLWAEIFHGNESGKMTFEKSGYQLEGVLKYHNFKGGKYIDSWIYGLLKS